MRISDWSSDVCSSDLAGQRVQEILVEGADLRREQQPLVDDRAARKARDVEFGEARQILLLGEIGKRVLGLLADGEQLALEGVLVLGAGAAGDNRLADDRQIGRAHV